MTLYMGPNTGLLINGLPGEGHYSELIRMLRWDDFLRQPVVKGRVATLPTTGQAEGDTYIFTGSGSSQNRLARWWATGATTAIWEYMPPRLGWRVQVANETTPSGQVKTYEYSGTAWVELVGGMSDAPSDGKRYARQSNAWTGLGAAAVADILGTVSQAGGVPTGAIYEGGSNANGSYVRLADGTQICSSSLLTFTAGSTSVGASWTFPASFVSPSLMFGTVVASGAGADYDPGVAARNLGAVYFNASTNSAALGFLCISSSSFTPGAQTRNNRAIAIGRWF
ncbi:DUF2793 domain-containing protein [Pseudomonas aeruginosa]|uniref:DUF2793 domain-containing protein n=1 Tax=Clostridioides difficile TaxID=1496 RepID=UPI001F23BE78|nr:MULTISPECIES: DUF2793 domain-containing protein [Bacteria]MDE9378323.1 DUF2793 domain-containing protein [Pseudomonas aeruginosa]MDH4686837.1 DUF2793 domain-containing protein [Pseudomonas aeruginosa]MDI2452240.1 DUF2793 domain-containing protein [Pseudomonas aeruginosa]MDI9292706.1 DUF2793 domain-containing protein [Pseudomonas aeruginosa]MDY6541309.1 DUF2793 domain-containing protein [Clostridioides difficile]